MKKILIPYDFSKYSENTLNYGVALAKDLSAGITLINIIPYPVIVPESGLPPFSYETIKEDTVEDLKKTAQTIQQNNPDIAAVDCISEMGDITQSIVDYCKKHPVEFVVMGIYSHGNKFLNSLMGSNAVSTSHKTKCTVIIVPPDTSYKTPKSIALASDPKDAQNGQVLEKAKNICALFKAELQILQVVPENHHFAPGEVVMNNYFERGTVTGHEPHKLFIITEKKVSEGLLGMLENKLIDMVILEPKEHSVFYKLFHESVSKELAFSSPVPVMMLHS